MQKKIQYFVAGHTANGFVNHISSNIGDVNQGISLKHPSHRLKTDILKRFIAHFENRYRLEIILSANGKDFLEGIIVPELSLAVITDTIMTNGIEATEFDLTDDVPGSSDTSEDERKVAKYLQAAYAHFQTGLRIHDDLEAVFISEMDFSKADQMAEKFIADVLADVQPKEQQSIIKRRLFGTNTYEGAVNIVPELLSRVSHRYYIKGRAGTGKSTFMRYVVKACEELGLDMEIYHCSFDPKSIDMVLVPEVDFCIFDSTDPHEFFPEDDNDIIIDLYEHTVTPGTDEKFQQEITEITKKYKAEIRTAMEKIKQSGEVQVTVEDKYPVKESELEVIFKKIIGNIRK